MTLNDLKQIIRECVQEATGEGSTYERLNRMNEADDERNSKDSYLQQDEN